MNVRAIIYVLSAAIFFSASLVSLCPAGGVPAEIRKAAYDGINIFFRDSRMTGLHNLGFTSQSDLDNASAGEGFQVFTIPPDRLLNKNLILQHDTSVAVVLKGGYGCEYSANTASSTINGSLTIKGGKVTLENLIIK
jgi:hypothetical protein